MTETEFPKTETYGEYEWLFDDIQNWFKRCVAAFPDTDPVPDWYTSKFTEWFAKWFSQFKEKDEDE